ncbi:hypothetical protein ABH945_006790 [Paraburkholderia sp. GAS333]|uniref:hypothetical protein n=1 Tax=Paraburkholderia sp. GAS333 TaxID=3156279 RepID=UPI003D1A1855
MRKIKLILSAGAVAALLSACGGGNSVNSSAIPLPAGVAAVQSGYTISVFARGPSASTLPDDIVVAADGKSVFVAYQDDQDPGGKPVASGKTTGEVIQYDLSGNVLKSFSVPGHCDGLLSVDADTLWASSNEDGNPIVSVIRISTGNVSAYTYNKALMPQSGGVAGTGGLDDMVIVNGEVYATLSGEFKTAASKLTPPGANSNPFPVLAKLSIDPDGKHFDLAGDSATTTAPAYTLMGNGAATDRITGLPRTLNVLDPDSLSLDPSGNVLLDDQNGHNVVIVSNLGTTSQKAAVLDRTLNGTPVKVDDTRFAPSGGKSFMLFTDNTASSLIYRVDYTNSSFPVNQAYSTSSSSTDSILALNYSTGVYTTVIKGLSGAHGMRFISN